MSSKLRSCLIAGAIGTTLALMAPALAFHGGGGMGGGMHMGGFGGGMHFGGMGGGAHFGGMGGPHFGGIGGARFGGMGGARFGGPGFAAPRSSFAAFHVARPGFSTFARPGFAPRFSHFAFHNHRFFFRHHHRFAFVGAPILYAGWGYDSCWRRVWTAYGPRWVDVCNYGYDSGY
jgi:hypothetical protein